MLDLLCYLIGVILLGIAALVPAVPYRDRFAYAGLALLALPHLVHDLNTH